MIKENKVYIILINLCYLKKKSNLGIKLENKD